MSIKTVIPVVAGLLVAVVGWQYLQAQSGKKVAATAPVGVPVVVAKVPISRAVPITKEMLEVRIYSKDSVPPNCFRDVKELLPPTEKEQEAAGEEGTQGELKRPDEPMVPRSTIRKGWPIGRHHVAKGANPLDLVPPGMRSYPIKADQVSAGTHLIAANNSVDVIWIGPRPGSKIAEPMSILLFQDVKVLAVGLDYSGGNDAVDQANSTKQRQSARSVTLLLDNDQVGTMAVATSGRSSKIQLIGRNPKDRTQIGDRVSVRSDEFNKLVYDPQPDEALTTQLAQLGEEYESLQGRLDECLNAPEPAAATPSAEPVAPPSRTVDFVDESGNVIRSVKFVQGIRVPHLSSGGPPRED